MNVIGHGTSFGVAAIVASTVLFAGPAAAQEVSFAGKTISIVIGSGPGGTTDTSTRLMAAFLTKYLPGSPSVIIQSRPGSHSITAMNYVAQQAKPDGLTVAGGSASQIDPETFRLPQAQYDPTKFFMIGGVDLGGGIVIMRKEAEARLKDKAANPVVMGSSSGLPSSTVLTAAWGIEFLGWNVRWVSGYPSQTSGMALVLQRGEIDMTGFSTAGLSDWLFDTSKYTVIYQTGSNRCSRPSSLPELKGVPLFADTLKGKLADPVAQKAFDYWCASSSTVVWIALPAGTPAPVVETFRAAFKKIAVDPEFLEQGQRFSKEFSVISTENMDVLVNTYAQTSDAVSNYLPELLRKQGRPIN